MSIIGSNVIAGASGQAGYNLNNSLRFRSSASAYLSRTPASTTNRRTYTYSFWTKYSTGSSDGTIFSTYGGSANLFFTIGFSDGGKALDIDQYNGSTRDFRCYTTQVFRDPSAWYHIVIAVDTTQTTAANRIKIYVNGSQVTALASATYPSLNFDTYVNTTQATNVGRRIDIPGLYYDGYLTEVNFIDGSALTPSSFGETSTTTGSWIPKKYTSTYGTNGFYLKFADASAATVTAIGKDSSGNGNNWTPSGISVTAGTTYDAMLDVPTNTSATVANYATLNPVDSYAASISQANLNFADGTGNVYQAYSTIASPDITAYKFYCEVTVAPSYGIGIAPDTKTGAGSTIDRTGFLAYYSTGVKQNGSAASTAYGASFTTGDIIGIAIGSGQIEFYKNNVSQGVAFSSLTGAYKFGVWAAGAAGTGCSFNFGQRPFSYTPPTGFVRLNTYNLPTSTIVKGNKYMDATLYTGTGASLAITNTGAFQPDLVWVKGRSGATDHAWYDSVRGTTKQLESNTTTAETTETTGLTAFGTGGFTVGALAQMNTSAATYVGWQWQAGQGTTSSNTSGTITSTVSVNASAGFSIVTYTGTGANATVGHGLGVAPSWVIVKRKDTTGDWQVRHTSIAAASSIQLNLSNNSASATTVWNSTAPSSTVFSIGTSTDVNASAGTYVAYCWAEIEGFSKFSSYAGNSSTDGPFVYTGFRPKFILVKKYAGGTASNWHLHDTTRDTYNSSNTILIPDTSGAEVVNAAFAFDILSNGFKLRSSDGSTNGSSLSYIYMAFAENPFKNANAR